MAGERRTGRTLGITAAILAAMLASLVYGYLIRRNHYFPYHLAVHTIKAIQPEPSERWHLARPDTGAGPGSPENIKHLANLPYLQGYRPATSGGGIRAYDRSLAQDELNLFVSAHAPVATLMDPAIREDFAWDPAWVGKISAPTLLLWTVHDPTGGLDEAAMLLDDVKYPSQLRPPLVDCSAWLSVALAVVRLSRSDRRHAQRGQDK